MILHFGYMTARPVEMRWKIRILPTFLCATGFTFACAVCFLLFSIPRGHVALHASPNEQTAGVHYAIVVDAGSSGSRLYIYRCDYDRHTVKSILRVSPLLGRDGEPIVKKKNPGLSSFGNDPKRAVVYMKGLIDGALDYIPKENVKQTSLFVLATAGMRLLPVKERTKVMKALRQALASSYDFIVSETNIEIISGKWEGIYAWISVNYALGRFDKSPLLQSSVLTQSNSVGSGRMRTAGILDLGGASLQVAYEVKRGAVHGLLDETFYQEINLGCNDTSPLFKFTVFVNTYLGYGANTAIELYENWLVKNSLKNRGSANSSVLEVSDCCLPRGLTKRMQFGDTNILDIVRSGSGCFHTCYKSLSEIIESNVTCSAALCFLEGVYLPEIDFASTDFYGMSEYWYSTNDVLNLSGAYDHEVFEKSASDFCNLNWTSIWTLFRHKKFPNADIARIRTQCFKAAWAFALLHKGLRFPVNISNFHPVSRMSGHDIQWTLGAVLYRLRHLPLRFVPPENQFHRRPDLPKHNFFRPTLFGHEHWILEIVFFVALLVLLLFVADFIMLHFCREKRGVFLCNTFRKNFPSVKYMMIDNSKNLRYDVMSAQGDVPLLSERKKCWSSRDNYWSCLDENNGDESKCKQQRAEFVSSCRRTWVNRSIALKSTRKNTDCSRVHRHLLKHTLNSLPVLFNFSQMHYSVRNWSLLLKRCKTCFLQHQWRHCSTVSSPDAMISLSKAVLRTSVVSDLVNSLLAPNDCALSDSEFSSIRTAVGESGLRRKPVDSTLLWYFAENHEFQRGLSYIRHLDRNSLLNPASVKVAVYLLITCFLNKRDIPTSDVAKILLDSLLLWQERFPNVFDLHLLFALGCSGEWNRILSLWPSVQQSAKSESANFLLISACRHRKLAQFWALRGSDSCRLKIEDSGLKELTDYLCSSLPDESFALDNFDKFLHFLRMSTDLLVDEDTAMAMKELFESFRKRIWSVKDGMIDAQGCCTVCGSTLSRVCISGEDFAEMKNEVFKKILIGENIYRQSSPKEVSRFQKLLATEGPFDVVIDGCNVALFGRTDGDLRLQMKRIINTVSLLREKHNFKKPLVIGRHHFLRCVDFMAQLSKMAHYFLAANVSTDDAFLLIAALSGGLQTYFVTNDLLGGHSQQLSEKSQFTFSQWQRTRQILLSRTKSPKYFICHVSRLIHFHCGRTKLLLFLTTFMRVRKSLNADTTYRIHAKRKLDGYIRKREWKLSVQGTFPSSICYACNRVDLLSKQMAEEKRSSTRLPSTGAYALELEAPIKFSPAVQSALNSICDPNDPFNREDFSVVEHINKLFSTEPGLIHVEEVAQELDNEMARINEEICQILEMQSSSSVDGQAALQEAKLVMRELFDKVLEIKRKTDMSDTMVTEITRDMKQLDLAKKNLTASITTLNHLHMLVSGVESLESYIKTKNFRDIANLLPGIQNVLEHFSKYKAVPQIRQLSEQMVNIGQEIAELVSSEFKTYFSPTYKAASTSAVSGSQPVNIVDVCAVISVLEEPVRESLIQWLLNHELTEYTILFDDTQDDAWLDKIDLRYGWFRDRLIEFENKYTTIFPSDWEMPKRLALEFVKLTGDMLEKVTAKRIAEIDSKLLIFAIQRTLNFEVLMSKRFPSQKSIDQQQGKSSETERGGFRGALSSKFEKHMPLYFNALDGNLNALVDQLAEKFRETGPPSMEYGSTAVVIPNSSDLFVFYKKCIQQLLQLCMSEQLMADLARLFKKYLREYAQRCLANFLPKITSGQVTTTAGLIQSFLKEGDAPRLSVEETYRVCCVLVTAEFCAETIHNLQEKLKEKAPSLAKQDVFDFTPEQEVFFNLISVTIQLLVQDLEGACDAALQTMTKMQWASVDAVGDESRYVNRIRQQLRTNVARVRDYLINARKYFIQFCLRFAGSFIPKFIGCLFRCKSVSVTGAEQLLLDTHSLKTELANLPVVGSIAGQKPPEAYTKVVLKGMTKAEMILKLVMAPIDCPDSFVDQYLKLLPESDVSEFQKVLDMKSVRRADQSSLMQIYHGKTSKETAEKANAAPAEGTKPLAIGNADSRVKKLEELIRKRL
ncbi:Vps53-like protein [Trichuris suis]|nr:Vps53-like protein [Trichuris suis]